MNIVIFYKGSMKIIINESLAYNNYYLHLFAFLYFLIYIYFYMIR
jgi:hypothetical protein